MSYDILDSEEEVLFSEQELFYFPLLEQSTCWVKITYTDKSYYLFQGTTNPEIYSHVGIKSLGFREVADLDKGRVIYVEPAYTVEVFEDFPGFDRRLDEFANQFI